MCRRWKQNRPNGDIDNRQKRRLCYETKDAIQNKNGWEDKGLLADKRAAEQEIILACIKVHIWESRITLARTQERRMGMSPESNMECISHFKYRKRLCQKKFAYISKKRRAYIHNPVIFNSEIQRFPSVWPGTAVAERYSLSGARTVRNRTEAYQKRHQEQEG